MSRKQRISQLKPNRGQAALGLVLLEALLVICWSSGFVGMRFAADKAPVVSILFWRSLVATLVLAAPALLIGPPTSFREIAGQVVVGTLAMPGYAAGYAFAIALGVPTGLVALIADMLPLAVALLAMPLLGQVVGMGQGCGLALGLLGVGVVSADAFRLGDAPAWAYGLPVLGMLALALATVLQKRGIGASMPLHRSLCLQSLISTIVFGLLAAWDGMLLPTPSLGLVSGILWLVLFGTFGGYGLYYLCLRHSSPTRVSSILLISPPLTMIWAWAMFGEPLNGTMAAGLLLSLTGVVVAARFEPADDAGRGAGFEETACPDCARPA